MNLTPEERAIGKTNFHSAIGSEFTRRQFLEGALAAGAVTGAGLGSFYFGYKAITGDPVRIGIIGTGDEGGVLMGALTPSYVNVVAIADIRPYNIHRAFHGDSSSPSVLAVRPGLMAKYGWKSEDEARKKVKVYDQDYKDLIKDKSVEAVIIALPLHLHAPVAIECMQAGKHVLTEKLMAHSVHECKEMARVSIEKRLHLATGHQRHYSILYDNAVQTIERGLLGDLHSIRAQWHRGNLPGADSWTPPLPAQIRKDLEKYTAEREKLLKKGSSSDTARIEALDKRLSTLQQQVKDEILAEGGDKPASQFGYQDRKLDSGYHRTPLEELIRWRLWDRTGGGLMAELGSHQLDASGIFCTAARSIGGVHAEKALPLSVNAVGGRYIFPQDRDIEDHVYCTFEYPGKGYEEDPNKKIGVVYSSINGNGFGGYGETVMGTKGTLILDKEQEVMLYPAAGPSTSVTVTKKKDDGPALDTTASGGSVAAELGKKALESGPISRGYTEEIEHFAWCIRNFDFEQNRPKCHPKVAMADAVIALTTNIAMRQNRRIEFKPEWFDIARDETPEDVPPSVKMPS